MSILREHYPSCERTTYFSTWVGNLLTTLEGIIQSFDSFKWVVCFRTQISFLDIVERLVDWVGIFISSVKHFCPPDFFLLLYGKNLWIQLIISWINEIGKWDCLSFIIFSCSKHAAIEVQSIVGNAKQMARHIMSK